MLLIVHTPPILRRERFLLIWQLIIQLKLMRGWFQTLFLLELRLNFGTKRQRKLKLILGLIILANLFLWLDTGYQDKLFHARVKFWKMIDIWGCYEIVFLRSLDKFHEKIRTVWYQTHMSVCLGLWTTLHKLLHHLLDLGFCTALSWWIGTNFPCRVGYPMVC